MNKFVFIGVLMTGCLMMGCSGTKEEKTNNGVSVVTERVQKSLDCDGTSFVGEVEAESSTAVSFSGSGTLLRVLVNEGQHVSKGQLIAVIDDTQSRNAMMAAEAVLTQAQDAYDRMKMLHDRKSLSEMDWVDVQSKLLQAKASVQMTKKAVEDCRLVAPCSGVVGKKMLEAGMTALPAQPVCNILNINKVKVKISVPEKEIKNISRSATVTVDALGGETFQSVGFEQGVSADAVSRTYEVRYILDNKDGDLLPGMVCRTLPTLHGEGTPMISVPITAVQRSAEGKMFVWTVKEKTAHRTEVTTGKASGNRIAVVSGLREGDEVVTKGYQKLNEDCKVR